MTTPEPQADTSYAQFYENISHFPIVGRFRRFAAEWAKLNHDNTNEVFFYAQRATEELQKRRGVPVGSWVNHRYVLDTPRSVVQAKYPDIYKSFWKPYEEALRQQGRDLCTSHQIMQMPEHSAHATRWLKTFKAPVFDNGRFGMTQELDRFYLEPSAKNDACAWIAQKDFLTEKYIQMAPWIDEHICRHFRSSKSRRAQRDAQQEDPPYLHYPVLVDVMDVLTCILVSGVLMSTMFALYFIKSQTMVIGAMGAFGMVFSILVKILASQSRRIEVCAATAAFFAVAIVFVSNSCAGSIGS